MRRKIVTACLLLLMTVVFAFPHAEVKASGYYEYEINSYNVDVKVTKQNILHITETIGVYFNTAKHGIYRKIPLTNQVTRLDGSSDTVRARVTNVDVNAKYSTSIEDGSLSIKIGDKDVTLTGQQEYVISYDYNLGNDKLSNADEFYFNIIGTEWDTTISNVTFTVDMPGEFDESKIGMSWGYMGSTNTENLYYYMDGTKICGYLDSSVMLEPSEGLTIRIELPDGYFQKQKENNLWFYLGIIIPLICLGIAALLWYKVGRDDEVVETVEFTAPENRNSAEVAFAYRGKVESEDVVSLIVYLANKGYLEIEEIPSSGIFDKGGFRLRKCREYDGNNDEERTFFNGLFSGRDTVTKKDLVNKFYVVIDAIKRSMNSKENKEVIFEKNSINKYGYLALMLLIVFAVISLPPIYNYCGTIFTDEIVGMIFPLVGFSIMIVGLLGGNVKSKIFIVIWGMIFGGVPFVGIFLPILKANPKSLGVYIWGLICAGGICFFLRFMSKRTPYGTKILGRIRGFRNFLEFAEKDRLEAMVADNPNYFYEILPYAYVLEVSDEWMKKFEGIELESPNWYRGTHINSFDIMAFNSFMNSTMRSANSSMTSSPSSSGGGSSGGGSGGGGGGSW